MALFSIARETSYVADIRARPHFRALHRHQLGHRRYGGKDDEGTVLDVDERTEMVIVYLGRHVGGRAFHRDDLRKVRAH
jgi:hypothetical protein